VNSRDKRAELTIRDLILAPDTMFNKSVSSCANAIEGTIAQPGSGSDAKQGEKHP
jgi:hypothetical protein